METKNIISVIVISLLLASGLLLEYKFEKDFNTFYSDGTIAAREDWYVEYQRTYFRLDKYIPKAVVCDRYTNTRCYPAKPYWQRLNRVLSKIYLTEEKNEFGTLVTKSTKYKDGSIRLDKIFTKNEPKIEEFPTSYTVNYNVGNKNRNYRLTWRIKNLNVKRYTEDLEIRNLCKLNFGFNITVDWCDEKEYFDYAELDISKRTLLVHFLPFKGDKIYSVRLFDPLTTFTINANSDDAWQTNTDSVTDDNKVVIGNAYGNNYYGGYRFNSISVPNGATINSAKIELSYNYQSGTNTAIDIYGEDIDNAPTFSTSDNDNITTRTKTGNVTNWASPHSSGTGNTSDIKTIVQEIIDRTGWKSGNSMAFLFYPASGNADEWESVSYNDAGTIKLYIDYTIVDNDSPIWKNQVDNESGTVENKAVINLSIQGKDTISLFKMTLSTNESGTWKNKTCNIVWEDHDYWANFAPYEIYRNITDTLINENMNQMLGIIVNDTDGNVITDDTTLVNYLNSIKENSTVEFCLHSDVIDEWENYNEEEARDKLERDNKVMWDSFGINATTFVPAGGGYNNSAMNAFVNNEWNNFTHFSTYDYEDLNKWEEYPDGLYHVPITTEFIDWGTEEMYSASEIETDCQTAIDDTGTCVFVLHFSTFKNSGNNNLNLTRYQILLDVIDWVKNKNCSWYDVNHTNQIVHDLVPKSYSGTNWEYANWSWFNETVKDTTVGWKVYLEDSNGNLNTSDINTFIVGSIYDNSSFQQIDDDTFIIRISNDYETVEYTIDDCTGSLNCLTVNYNDLYSFKPSNMGGFSTSLNGTKYYPWSGSPFESTRISITVEDLDGDTFNDAVTFRFNYSDSNAWIVYDQQFLIENGVASFVLKEIESSGEWDTYTRDFTFDRSENIPNNCVQSIISENYNTERPDNAGISYINYSFGQYFTMYIDWQTTNASRIDYREDCTKYSDTSYYCFSSNAYSNNTNGVYPKAYDKVYMIMSKEADTVINFTANMNNPVSTYKDYLANKIIVDYWHNGDFNDAKNSVEEIYDYGLKDVVFTMHDWQKCGYDYCYPEVLPANTNRGGNSGLIALSESVNNRNMDFVLHENYVDFYNTSTDWNEDDVALDFYGNKITSYWEGGHYSYLMKPTEVLKYSGRYSPNIHNNFSTTGAFLDVHASVRPLDKVDYDSSIVNYSRLTSTWNSYIGLFNYIRNVHNGPVYGEGQSRRQPYWSGYIDSVEAQLGNVTGNESIYLVNYDLFNVHPYSVNHGAGYYERFFKDKTSGYRPNEYREYRASEIAFGRIGFIPDLSKPTPLKEQINEYYIMKNIQNQFANVSVESVLYPNTTSGTVFVNLTDAYQTNDFSQVKINYTNGLEVYVNKNDDWSIINNGVTYVLPKFGWFMHNPNTDFIAYSAKVNGRFVEYVNSDYIVYNYPESCNAVIDNKFDLSSGNVTKEIGYGNNGTMHNMNSGINNGNSGRTSNGKHGNAIMFDGIDDYIKISNSNSLANNDLTKLTVEFWLNESDRSSNFDRILDKGWAGYGSLLVSHNGANGYNMFAISGLNGCQCICNWGSVTDNTFNHFVGGYNGTHTFTYLNGGDISTTECSSDCQNVILNNTNDLYIGGKASYLNGTLDELKIYPYELTKSEVTANYNLVTEHYLNATNEDTIFVFNYLDNSINHTFDKTYSVFDTISKEIISDTNPSGVITIDSNTGVRYFNMTNSIFVLNDSYNYIKNNGIKMGSIDSEVVYNGDYKIAFNSSQNYTNTNWNIYVSGDKTSKTWRYKSHYGTWVNIDSGNISYNNGLTLFELKGINVSECSNSNELRESIPDISYISPTLPNDNVINNNYYIINTSITDESDVSGLIDWNYSLVGWWRFDNSTDLKDHSSYSNDGTNHDSTYTYSGKFGGARDFDGNNDYVNCGTDMEDSINKITYELWFKLDSLLSSTVTLYSRLENGFTAIQINSDEKIFYGYRYNPGNNYYESVGNDAISIDTWYHLVVTYDSSGDSIIYLNGNIYKQEAAKGELNSNANGIVLIGNQEGTSRYFNGTIDEIRIYNRILSAEEVNASFNSGIYRLWNNFTDLSEGTYTYTAYAIDEAGNVNNAGTRNITYNSGSCTSHSDCTNQFCAYNGVCTDYYSDLADCENKEFSGLEDDTVCISNTTGWCYSDSYDSVGEFCTNSATECVHNGVSYSTTYELCSGNNWYKQCLSGEWQSQVNCNTSNSQCDPGLEDSNCGYKLADICTDGTGCVPNSCVDCGYYYSLDTGTGCESSTSENCDISCGAPYDSTTCSSPNILNNDCSCTYSDSILETIYPNPARKGTEAMFDPPDPVDDFSGTIFSSSELTAISSSDDSRVTLYGVDSKNPFNKLNFSLPSYDSINKITFTFEASSDGTPTRYFFIWNYTSSLWESVYDEYAGSADNTSIFSITSGWDDYVSNNQINYMIEDDCNYCDLYSDFAKIDFNYTSTTSLPVYSDSSSNGTLVNTHVFHKLKWTDPDGLDSSIFSFDNGVGSFTNDSAVSLSGTEDWTNVTKILTSSSGVTVRWKVFCNDTIGNLRESQVYSYTTTEAGQFAVNVTHILFNKTPGNWYKVGAFELNSSYVWGDCPYGGKATCYENFEEDLDRMVKYGGSEETWIMVENGNYIASDGTTNFLPGFWDISEWADTYNTANPNANVKIHFRTHGYPSTVDYSIQSVRDNIVNDCWKALTGDGGNHYEYDGVFVNIEPFPNGDQNAISLMEELRDNISALSGKKLGNDALPIDDIDNPDTWRWNITYANQLESPCNYTGAMIYWTSDDPLQGTYWKHRQWYQDQMNYYREVCSGIENHQLLFGMANAPSSESHDQNVENITNSIESMYLATSATNLPKPDGIRIFSDEFFGFTSPYEYYWLLMKANYSYDEDIKVRAFLRESADNVYVSIIDSDDNSFKVTNQTMSLNNTDGFYEADISGFPNTDSEGNYTVRIYVVKSSGAGYQDSHKDALYIQGTEVSLTVDSPINNTYLTKTVWFNVTLGSAGEACRYNLDSSGYVYMSNDSLTHFYGFNNSMSHDSHYVYIICNDSSGKENDEEVYFTVDLTPTSNSPGDGSYSLGSSHTINWILKTPDSAGYYNVYRDSVLQNSTTWVNNTNLAVWVNSSLNGIFNYTITYNDSIGRNGIQDEVIITITGGNDGTSCTLDSECTSGYCDNDGVYGADDNWCFSPYNSYFDGEESPYCEYSTGLGIDKCDELSVGTDLDECVGISYYEQECSSSCDSIDVTSVFECTDSGCNCDEILCDEHSAGFDLTKCSHGYSYFADECSSTASGQDRDAICRSSSYDSSCTGNANCNGITNGALLGKCIGISYYEDKCSSTCEIEDVTTTFECTDTDCSCTEPLCDEKTEGFDLDKCVGISYYEEECSSTAGLQDITSVFECTDSGCSCSDIQCDGLTINSMLTNCSAEQTYLQDKCSSTADTKDSNICRSSEFHSSCTGDIECDGEIISTGDCDSTCSYTGGTGGDITVYLNGSSGNKYYEYGSKINITAISDQGAYMCMDIPMIGYGDDYVCGSSSITSLVDAFGSKQEFNVSTPATLNSNTTLYLEHRKFDVIDSVYLGLDGTSVSDISIDVGNDGNIEHNYPGELNNNLFEISKLSTGVTEKNLTFKTAGTEIVYLNIPKNYEFNNFTFDLTGSDYIVEETDNFYTDSNFKAWNVEGTIWAIDLEITSDILSGNTLTFPSGITEEGKNVHPIKVYNITSIESEDSPVIATGTIIGGSGLGQSSNKSETDWVLSSDLKTGDKYRVLFGKNVTWFNETGVKEIAVNNTDTVSYAILNVYPTHSQEESTYLQESCSLTLNCYQDNQQCADEGYGCPCYYYNTDKMCDSDISGTYSSNNALMCSGEFYAYGCPYGNRRSYPQGTVLLSYKIEDINSVSYVKLNYRYYQAWTKYYSYLYNTVTSLYEIVVASSNGVRHTYKTEDSDYKISTDYKNGNLFNVKMWFEARSDDYYGYFWEPTVYYNRSAYNPRLEIGSSTVWSNSGILMDSDTSDNIYEYLNGDNLFKFNTDGNYGEIIVYFTPFWTSSPSNVTVKIGNSDENEYTNTTVFNTSETITIESTNVDNFMDECTSVTCNLPIYITTKTQGILEISNINLIYSLIDNKIQLNNTALNSFLDRNGAVTEVEIPIRITGEFGDLEVSVNDTYYGLDEINITVSELGNSSNTDNNIATVVFSNYSINYPSGIEYWEIFPYSKTQNGVIPFGGNPIFLTEMLGDSISPVIDVYVRLNESLGCATIYSTSTTGANLMLSTSDQIICNDVTYSGTCNISNTVNLACSSYLEAYIEPVFIFTGKCNGC